MSDAAQITPAAQSANAAGIAGIETIISEIARGRMIVLVDDEERENEGDLLMPARFVTADAINFMSQYGRGLICLTLDEAHCRRLNLPLMTDDNQSRFATKFTVSIEAASGVSTGISAADRAHTILTASNPNARAEEIVRPGHIFPIRAEKGGVLVRAGHTEAGCDLTAMAGLYPAAVICEVMNDDGSMARLPDLLRFARRHGLQVGTIKSLIEHRLRHEQLVERLREGEIETAFGRFKMTVYRDKINHQLHLALHRGEIAPQRVASARVMIYPTVVDTLGVSGDGWGVAAALRAISAIGDDDAAAKDLGRSELAGGDLGDSSFQKTEPPKLAPAREEVEQPPNLRRGGHNPHYAGGVVVLLAAGQADEGKLERQVGLAAAPARAAGVSLRHYGLGAQILRDLGVGRIRLLSGKVRLPSMEGFGLVIEEIVEP